MRSRHFIPLSTSKISHKLTSEDENVDVFDFDNNKAITNVSDLRVSAYVSVSTIRFGGLD